MRSPSPERDRGCGLRPDRYQPPAAAPFTWRSVANGAMRAQTINLRCTKARPLDGKRLKRCVLGCSARDHTYVMLRHSEASAFHGEPLPDRGQILRGVPLRMTAHRRCMRTRAALVCAGSGDGDVIEFARAANVPSNSAIVQEHRRKVMACFCPAPRDDAIATALPQPVRADDRARRHHHEQRAVQHRRRPHSRERPESPQVKGGDDRNQISTAQADHAAVKPGRQVLRALHESREHPDGPRGCAREQE